MSVRTQSVPWDWNADGEKDRLLNNTRESFFIVHEDHAKLDQRTRWWLTHTCTYTDRGKEKPYDGPARNHTTNAHMANPQQIQSINLWRTMGESFYVNSAWLESQLESIHFMSFANINTTTSHWLLEMQTVKEIDSSTVPTTHFDSSYACGRRKFEKCYVDFGEPPSVISPNI